MFPPALGIPFALLVWSLVRGLVGDDAGSAMVAGGIFGYMNYDMTHWYIHHARPKLALYRWLKSCHTLHHFKNHDANFGISPAAKLLDFAFGTHVEPPYY